MINMTAEEKEAASGCQLKIYRLCIRLCKKCAEVYISKGLTEIVGDDNDDDENARDGPKRRQYILRVCDDCIEKHNRRRLIQEPPYV